MSKVIIIGAGMAGLLAGNMLRSLSPVIHEAQAELPNNHHALLRFRTEAVAHAIGVPFKKVKVMKDVHSSHRTDLAAMLAYSMKVNGVPGLRSIGSAISANGPEERFIAPGDLIQRMANGLVNSPVFNSPMTIEKLKLLKDQGAKIISTMPMSVLMSLLSYSNYSESSFRFRTGQVLRAKLPEHWSIYATIYFPDEFQPFYRASITGNELIVEFVDSHDILQPSLSCNLAIKAFGIDLHFDPSEVVSFKQKYAKILPIDEAERKEFILWASREWGIYSLGRFATWRPGLLMDDCVNDVRIIQNMIAGDNSKTYEEKKNA